MYFFLYIIGNLLLGRLLAAGLTACCRSDGLLLGRQNTRLLILIGRSHVWMSEDAIIRQKSEKAQELVSPCASVSKRCAIVLMWCDASCRRPKRPVLQAARGTALPNLDSHHGPAYHSPAQSNSNRLIPCSAQTGLNQQISPAQAGRYTAWLRQPQHPDPVRLKQACIARLKPANHSAPRPPRSSLSPPVPIQTGAVKPIMARSSSVQPS